MVTSTSRLSYSDCFDLMNTALDNTKGIRVECRDFDAANHFRMRIHAARTIDRKDNEATYEEGHPLHGRSVYDELVIRVRDEGVKTWMYLEKISLKGLTIEPLGEANVVDKSANGDSREVEGKGEDQPGESTHQASPEPEENRITADELIEELFVKPQARRF